MVSFEISYAIIFSVDDLVNLLVMLQWQESFLIF